MSELTPAICEAFVRSMMSAIAIHRATGNGAEVGDGLSRLDAVRCAWRGEFSDEEKEAKAQRAVGLLAAWCMEPNGTSNVRSEEGK